MTHVDILADDLLTCFLVSLDEPMKKSFLSCFMFNNSKTLLKRTVQYFHPVNLKVLFWKVHSTGYRNKSEADPFLLPHFGLSVTLVDALCVCWSVVVIVYELPVKCIS